MKKHLNSNAVFIELLQELYDDVQQQLVTKEKIAFAAINQSLAHSARMKAIKLHNEKVTLESQVAQLQQKCNQLQNANAQLQRQADEYKQQVEATQRVYADTLASLKFQIGTAIADAVEHPLKLFALPVKIIKILRSKRKGENEIIQ